MNPKKLILGSLMVGGLLAAMRMLFGKIASSKSTSSFTSQEAIDIYLEDQMRRLKIPGAVMVIVEDQKIVHTHSFGQVRPGGELPSPQTPFFIGSLTKSFTALAVMQLAKAGKVCLDAPVQNYLPWFRVADSQKSAQITVRHLLNQTSGLPESLGERLLADFDDRLDATECQVRSLSTVKIPRPVGSKCEYSNLNYNILGLIVEVASGELYADYIQSHIFNPLGMKQSFSSKETAKQNGLAMGHRHWFSFPFPAPHLLVPRGSLPSGQLIASAEDIAHYLIAHLNGGHYGNVKILSEAGIEELHRGEAEYIKWGFSGGRYGMGWFEIIMGRTKTFSHGGNVPDFSSFAVLIPAQKRGLVLLLNADPYGMPTILAEVGMGLASLLTGKQPAPIRLNFIQWMMRLLPLIPLLQVTGVFTTLRKVKNWQQNPQSRPSYGRLWSHHILLPLIPNLSLAGILVYMLASKMFGFFQLFMPDISLITLISGGFAGIWSILRTVLILGPLRKPR